MKKILTTLITLVLMVGSVFALDWYNPLEDVVFTHDENYSEWQAELKGVNPDWFFKPSIILSSDNIEDAILPLESLFVYNEQQSVLQSDILELVQHTIEYNNAFVGISFYETCAVEIVTCIDNGKILIFVETIQKDN